MRNLPPILIAAMLILGGAHSTSAQMVAPLSPGTRTISVTGHGDTKAKPDELIASFTVESKAETVDECTRQQSEKMNRVVEALKGKLNGKGEVRTSNFSVTPFYEPMSTAAPATAPSSIIGQWSASIQIQAMADRIEDIAPAIRTGLAAGAGRVTQSGMDDVSINSGAMRMMNSGAADNSGQFPNPTRRAPWVNLEVQSLAATPDEATTQSTLAARRVEKALKDKLGSKIAVHIEQLSIIQINQYNQQNQANYQVPPQRQVPNQPRQAYNGRATVVVTTPQMDLLGPLIEAGMAAGASQLDSVSFTLSSDATARNDAISAASKDAQSKAQALAASMGVKLGKALAISINAQPRPQTIYGSNLMMHSIQSSMASLANMPVLPREVGFGAEVNAVYEIN